ncbi:DUF4148 domain-containing protein [Trinickia fusca]|uniref:DUF4148 domain-containing protein n=1 Tax=Trinickia fusca TaxID=2419777 RepID=A0A494XS22_9BURK|nr:DUF4148 domain-containing protein [Trinickia fusca]RKP52612.1 DUF4148 domain-containing protein [Trinickia fusca]
MKSLINAVALTVALAAPVVTFAQSNQPLTREQVRQDLIRMEQAGYNPSDWMHYPDNAQAALKRISAQQQAAAPADTSGYGTSVEGMSQSGQRTEGVVSSYSPPIYQHN